MILDTATWLSVTLASTAMLISVLLETSIAQQLTSALALAIVPVAAVFMVAATLITLMRLLGAIHDLLRAALVRVLVSCMGRVTAFRVESGHSPELTAKRILARITQMPLEGAAIGRAVELLLSSTARGLRKAWRVVVRELVLEALWIRQVAPMMVGRAPLLASWPVRTFARLLLKIIGAGRRWIRGYEQPSHSVRAFQLRSEWRAPSYSMLSNHVGFQGAPPARAATR